MLSTLLRRILLVQVLTGALLGWLVTRQTEAPNWLAWVGALALPLLGCIGAAYRWGQQTAARGSLRARFFFVAFYTDASGQLAQ